MTTLKPMTIALGLVALLTSAPAFAATMTGSVQTADGDSIVATSVVLYGSQGASLESHSTDDDGTFSIEIGAGAVAAAAKAANLQAMQRLSSRPYPAPSAPGAAGRL